MRSQGFFTSAEKQMRLIHSVADLEILIFSQPSTKLIYRDDLSSVCLDAAPLHDSHHMTVVTAKIFYECERATEILFC